MNEMQEDLGCAIYYMKRMYRRITKFDLLWTYSSEKGFSFKLPEFWIQQMWQRELLAKIVFKCINKFPEAEKELLEALFPLMLVSGDTSYRICWYNGYITKYLEDLRENLQLEWLGGDLNDQ